MVEEKHNHCLGECQIIDVSARLKVANLYGQYNYGYNGARFTNYIALTEALCKLFKLCNSDVAIPFNIGCCRGGADWSTVLNIISTLAIDFPHHVYLYKYNGRG